MEKEMVQKFDLEAAFKALDEIETPKAKGLKANRVDLKERFTTKGYGEELVEDYYNINDHEALEEAKEDREAEVAKAKLARIEKIVDLDAQTEDDLLPSYVGKVIIQCPQCMTLFYKNPEDIEKSEENPDVVNINEICQHCGNASGYTLIGKVDTVGEDEAANYEAAEEGTEENELNLDFGAPTEEVSPEGTGGGFEEEEVVIEEGSEDSSDDELVLDEIDLNLEEPVEESVQHEQLNESEERKSKLEKARADADLEETDRFIIYCSDADGNVLKTVKVHGKPTEIKNLMKDLLDEHKDAVDIYASKIFKNIKTKEEKEIELDSYTISREIEESLKEEVKLEDGTMVETSAEAILDAAAEAGKEVVKEVEADLTKPEVKKITDEVVVKELDIPVVEEGSSDDSSDDEITEALSKSDIEAKLDAFAASLGVEEGYTGNPAERTTHLEYTDDDPTDGKAVLPKAIEKQLTEEEKKDCDCKDGICECNDKNAADTPLSEGKFDVSDAEFKAMLNDKVFQEFGEDLKEEKVTEAKGLPSDAFVDKLANDILDTANEFDEDINITNNDSPARVDNRKIDTTVQEKPVEEGILGAVDSVVGGVVDGVKNLLASNEAEKKDIKEGIIGGIEDVVDGVAKGVENILGEGKQEEGLGLLGIGDVNVNLDASGQNNAVGVGGGEGKTESCKGPDCKEEKHTCEKCGKEPCECKEEGLLPGLDSLPLPKLPGLSEKCEDLHEESLNKHISDYLTEVYANVKNFEATDCSFKGNTLVVEGTINFNSGKSRHTKFEFTESKDGELGRVILEGYNKELAEDSHFTLNCLLEDSGKCLVTEGFGYKYTINNTLVEGLK